MDAFVTWRSGWSGIEMIIPPSIGVDVKTGGGG